MVRTILPKLSILSQKQPFADGLSSVQIAVVVACLSSLTS